MNKKVIGCLVALVILCCALFCVGIIGFIYFVSQTPYEFTDEQLTTSYLENIEEIGGLERSIIDESFGFTNPVFLEDGSIFVYFSEDGSYNPQNLELTIENGNDRQVLDNSIEAITDNCRSSTSTSGIDSYIKGTCDGSEYYAYIDGNEWILFTDQSRNIDLDDILEEFVKIGQE